MEPITINCDGACTVQHVVELELPILQLSLADGAAIAGAVLAVWAVGFGFRALIRTLKETDGNSSSTNETE